MQSMTFCRRKEAKIKEGKWNDKMHDFTLIFFFGIKKRREADSGWIYFESAFGYYLARKLKLPNHFPQLCG